MGLTVFWTESAINQLEDIFEYYKITTSTTVAQKIVNVIVDKSLVLEKQPQIGPIEELLKERKNLYRYLVEGNYKIIYWVEVPYIKIAAVFDCRQNPVKMDSIG
jgi:Plasmid stabilization system protein